ncbi:MAG: hypothetical protein IJV61_00420 [Paludibacteraceae bacterium]|nr:hypothetical protein [Paludibacteraceae bacterium]
MAFVGDYSYVLTGEIELYMGDVSAGKMPLDHEGEFTFVLGEASDEILMIEKNDTSVAVVSNNTIYMEPVTQIDSLAEVDMEVIYDYGEATLVNNQLDWQVEVSITATYKGAVLSGSGPIEIVATKKSSSPV